MTLDKIKGLSAGGDAAALAKLRTEEAEIRTRLKMSHAKLRVSQGPAEAAGTRRPNEAQKDAAVRTALQEAAAAAEKLA